MRHGAVRRIHKRVVLMQTPAVTPALCPRSFIVKIEGSEPDTQRRDYVAYYERDLLSHSGGPGPPIINPSALNRTDNRKIPDDRPSSNPPEICNIEVYY